jgi:hypothetical protein
MKSKFPALLTLMAAAAMACVLASGCSSPDNPKIAESVTKDVPSGAEIASKIKPEPTKIGSKVVDYEKKAKYMEAMGKRKKETP